MGKKRKLAERQDNFPQVSQPKKKRKSEQGGVFPPQWPPFATVGSESASMLAEDSTRMEWERRAQEQAGEGHYGKVQVKERHEQSDNAVPEGELQNDIAQHPLLDRQNFDGVDPNLNPEPPLNSEARREYDNAQRLQHQKKLERQKQLNNTPENAPSSSPTPRPGG